MKMNEVLTMGGAYSFMQAGVNLHPQVVQPQSRQAFDPDQDSPNKPAKETVAMKKKDLQKINQKEVDQLKNYFDDEKEWKEVADIVDKNLRALERKKREKKPVEDEEY